MFFKNQIPSVYDEDLEKPNEVLTWLSDLLTGADIEQITNDILDKFIATKSYLAVVFFKEDEKKSTEAMLVLEEIDDDLDEVGCSENAQTKFILVAAVCLSLGIFLLMKIFKPKSEVPKSKVPKSRPKGLGLTQ